MLKQGVEFDAYTYSAILSGAALDADVVAAEEVSQSKEGVALRGLAPLEDGSVRVVCLPVRWGALGWAQMDGNLSIPMTASMQYSMIQ